MNKYQAFCQKLLKGEMPHKAKFYLLDNYSNDTKQDSDIKIISPTQSSVEQAKSEVESTKDINTGDVFNSVQYGGSSGVKQKKKKAKVTKPTSSSKGGKKKSSKKKSSPSKKQKNSKKNKKHKPIKFKWM